MTDFFKEKTAQFLPCTKNRTDSISRRKQKQHTVSSELMPGAGNTHKTPKVLQQTSKSKLHYDADVGHLGFFKIEKKARKLCCPGYLFSPCFYVTYNAEKLLP